MEKHLAVIFYCMAINFAFFINRVMTKNKNHWILHIVADYYDSSIYMETVTDYGGISNPAERLKSFSDSVLIVAVVLLVYNLATLAGSEPKFFELGTFFNALIAYIGSFIAVFFYWSRFTLLLDYIDTLDDIVIFIALTFLIIVTLTPVSYKGLLQTQKATLF